MLEAEGVEAPGGYANTLLRVSGLGVEVASTGTFVVSDINFDIQAGRMLGLVGESGSGKTTVGLALLGYARRGLRISAGKIEVDGEDILKASGRQRRLVRRSRIAYVPQDPGTALNPALRIGVQLEETLTGKDREATQQARENLEDLLNRLSLPKGRVLSSYPHQLSGGQLQRVTLAMAFAHRPSVIVLDEPTTGLDVTVQREVMVAVRELCDLHGVAGVFVSHDLPVVSELVDDVAVLYAGSVVEYGSAKTVFQRPSHPYTRRLLLAAPSPDHAHALVGLPGRAPRPGERPKGCDFSPRCEFTTEGCLPERPSLISMGVDERHMVRCIHADQVRDTVSLASGSSGRSKKLSNAAGVAALSVNHVDAHYGSHLVLHDVSLQVDQGECLAVVGESGSGKTTLARCIVGLHSNLSGAIELAGKPMAHTARARGVSAVRSMQYIFQSPYASLNPRKSVEEILDRPLRHFFNYTWAERSSRINEALEDVALGADSRRRYPHQLSGGERQRVAIARALVAEPSVVICDEITSALDVSVQASIVETLRRLQQERNLALLFITHNLALVRSIAQKVVVMKAGVVVEAGLVDAVLDDPTDAYTRQLLSDLPRLSTSGV